jgi:lysozyme
MSRTRNRVAKSLVLMGLAALAGCGTRHVATRYAVSHSQMSVPSAAQASPYAAIAQPNFGDAHPVSWPGRTPASHPVHGIDVSRYQTNIDWHTARAHGVSFAFIKATEGADWEDPAFAGHWISAGAAGVPRGAYHFYYFCRSAAEQARWFIDHVPRERSALPPVLDIEWNSASRTCPLRPDPAFVRAEAMTFLNIVGQHYYQRPILYTTLDFWHENQLWLLDGVQPWLRSVAQHPSDAYADEPWSFWQYSGTGLVPGITGPVDVNAFAGSHASWAVWLAENTH